VWLNDMPDTEKRREHRSRRSTCQPCLISATLHDRLQGDLFAGRSKRRKGGRSRRISSSAEIAPTCHVPTILAHCISQVYYPPN
jgi:hypothetical protein